MESLQGHLLIAAPELRDPNFVKTVTLIVQHGKEGALGLVLNRATDTTLQEAWKQVSESPCEVESVLFHGGPCEGVLMVLHGQPEASQVEVLPGVHFSTEREDVQWLVGHNEGPMRFFVGYAGWGAGQLESELNNGAWLVVRARPEDVFQVDDDQWQQWVRKLSPGVDPRLLPRDPSVN